MGRACVLLAMQWIVSHSCLTAKHIDTSAAAAAVSLTSSGRANMPGGMWAVGGPSPPCRLKTDK